MRGIALALVLSGLTVLSITPASAGPCNYPDDRASDGSRCGGRAASERPGGR